MQKLFLQGALGLALLIGPNVIYGQDGHICDLHPKTRHDGGWIWGGWKRISLTTSTSTPIVTGGDPTWQILHNHTARNPDCAPATSTVSTSKSVTHSCTVGGGITLGGSVEFAAGALFAKCKTTASAEVEVNGSYSDTNEVTVQISSQKIIPPCGQKKYTFEIQKKTASGTVDTYDHKIVCQNVSTSKRWTGYCNKTTLSGDAVGWGDTRDQWVDLGKIKDCPCELDGGGIVIEDSKGKQGK